MHDLATLVCPGLFSFVLICLRVYRSLVSLWTVSHHFCHGFKELVYYHCLWLKTSCASVSVMFTVCKHTHENREISFLMIKYFFTCIFTLQPAINLRLCVSHRTGKQEAVQKTSTVIRLSSTPLRYQKNNLHFLEFTPQELYLDC